MNVNKWLNASKAVALAMALVLLLAAGLSLAQEPNKAEDNARQADEMQSAGPIIPIQGMLTDSSGNPLSGEYSITATLYTDDAGGEALCFDRDTVQATDGQFNMKMNFCTSDDIDGKALYLGIKVGSDPEMTPRQEIYPVPYAWSLRPGAIISASRSSSSILHIENWSASGRGLRAYAMAESGVNYGVVGASRSPDGYGGYFYNNGGGTALYVDGTGTIKSSAKSYVWVSGNNLVKANSDDTTKFSRDLYGGFKITGGSGWATPKVVVLPVTIAGQLYGQNITVTGLDLYYTVSADLTAITATSMRRQNGVGAGDVIFTDSTDLTCTSGSQCEKHWDLTQNNILSDGQGIIYIAFELGFPDSTANVQIGGVRLTIEHD